MKIIATSQILLAIAASHVAASDQFLRGLRPNHCAGRQNFCDCATCEDYSEDPNTGIGSVRVSVGHCSKTSISWMCCAGTDGTNGQCQVEGGAGGNQRGKKDETGLIHVTDIPKGASEIVVQLHDGINGGPGIPAGPSFHCAGGAGGSCNRGLCQRTFDLTDCGKRVVVPTEPPTKAPTEPPTKAPTEPPTEAPTAPPTSPPTKAPTPSPTKAPATNPPTKAPTAPPTKSPTPSPTKAPATNPPTTKAPATNPPTEAPTTPPTNPPATKAPTTKAPTNLRPTGTPRNPPTTSGKPLVPNTAYPGMSGDPHIKNWAGVWFDYHGECDLNLMSAPLFDGQQDFDVHVRTKIQHWYSYIEAAAIRIGNDIFELGSWGDYALNGVEGAVMTDDMVPTVGGYPLYHQQVNPNKHVFDIVIAENENITLSTFKSWVNVNIKNGDVAHFGKVSGLMGTYNGKMLSHDGLDLHDNLNALGQDWQIKDGDAKLFRTQRAPQWPEQCRLPKARSIESRRMEEGSITEEAAKLACADWTGDEFDNCVFDVLATQDLDVADAGAF